MNPGREIPQDPALPHLSAVLDSECMAATFQRAHAAHRAPRNSWSVSDCRIESVKYRPGKSCLVGYELTLAERGSGRRRRHKLSARVYRGGNAHARFLKARQQPLWSTADFPPLWHIVALDMVVWAFPNERKLTGLPQLVDPSTLRDELLPELVQARFGADHRIAKVDVDTVHYAPERSAAARASVTFDCPAAAVGAPWVVFGKAYADDQGRATLHTMQALYRSPAVRQGRLLIPRPLAYQAGQRILWQEGLPGRTFLDRFADGDDGLVMLDRVTATVAALHQTPLSGASAFSSVRQENQLELRAGLLATAVPDCEAVLQDLVGRLLEQARHIDRSNRATLHGDLHAQNVFIVGSEMALIDLDNVCHGPPLQDIGSWLGALLYRNRLLSLPSTSARQQIAAFVSAYRDQVPWPVPLAAVRWYTATALIVERAFRCLSRLKPGRLALARELIVLAEELSLGRAPELPD